MRFEYFGFIQGVLWILTGATKRRCPITAQSSITRCAEPLYELGAFRPDADTQSFTWEFFARQTQTYFREVCDAFYRFDLCIEPYKTVCFDEEPIQSQYQTAVSVLEFLCRDGYSDMLENFDCFVDTLTRGEMMRCQSNMVSETQRLPNSMDTPEYLQRRQVCGVMQDYMGCVSIPIQQQCGHRAWDVVREVVQRPTSLVMPDCTLAASSIIPSIVLLIITALMVLCN